ncbi:vomeronasal type-2 receptor 26-like [Xenopus tropicalis]|uniref:Vomeronasal type-2 receptor 26-like n=1 Tax=Xenopus tropicalis TaxID=8364 RepID=A0A8J1JNM8_XENTR|nr:vomeronasal type-2 receptor 26-like [Xenopus tropicalis]
MSHLCRDQLSKLQFFFALFYESMEMIFSIKLKVFLVVLMFQVFSAAAEMPNPSSMCRLSSSSDTKYLRTGEFIVGGMFHIKDAYKPLSSLRFYDKPQHYKCSGSSFRQYRYLLVFIHTIEEINKDPEILPNVTLGYHIFDSCDDAQKSLEGTFSILSGTQQLIPNYSCWNNRKVVGFIGDLSSVSSLSMASLTGIYRYPQISYGSRDPVFNDRVQFPSFYRTIPDELSEINGIVELIKHFGWKWVGLIVSDDEIGLRADAQSCIRCSKDEMSNKEKNGCIPKNINFLSYEDMLGATLSFISVICSIACAVILGIFIKYRETPIVRANNRYLSCLLLISLMLCFLCTLLFIGRPTQICCLLRHVTFGIVFTISVSSVLAKTLTVIIAFNATKPGSKLKKYVGTQLATILVIVCSLGESIISIVWLASNPPFSETDFFSDPYYIILQCNEGSGSFFFCIIEYIGTLALLSFIAAFLAKDFPDRFNEAKNITFSMLGFCSVWGAFVPAYLSSKGSRMVAILSSSAGLLGCIFIPKCYIIFLRPDIYNSKHTIVKK